MKARSPLEVYRYLPKLNCRDCGEKTCMAFATKLLARERRPEECPRISEDSLEKLRKILAPSIREIVLRSPAGEFRIGGEDVMFRHELRFFNPTLLAVDISDNDDVEERIERALAFKKDYLGKLLTLDGFAIRNKSMDESSFLSALRRLRERTDRPLILISRKKSVLDRALRELDGERPLVCYATKDNWAEMLELARKHDCPIAIRSSRIDELLSISRAFSRRGVEDVVLDPVLYPAGKMLSDSLNRLFALRKMGLDGVEGADKPLLTVPAVAWLRFGNGDQVAASYWESLLASLSIARYADIAILRTLEPWALLPVVTLRENIYSDPRKHPKVEAGLKIVGKPDRRSPVFITTNFALTYHTVVGDLETSGISGYLLLIDTGGIGVEASVAGGQLNAERIKEHIDESGIEKLVDHRYLIIPGLAARLKGEIERVTGWRVLVGPVDSSQIGEFLEKNWPPRE